MSEKKSKLRTAGDVLSRLRWSTSIEDSNQDEQRTVLVGYMDRFEGPMEQNVNDYNDGDIPEYRILYFRHGEEVVWDRAGRVDRLFGSGQGKDAPVAQKTMDAIQQATANMIRIKSRNNKIVGLNDAIERIDYLAILDFEATCDHTIKMDVQEIIEFPTLFVSTETGKIDYTFHTYVKPQVHPTLTAFCTELTGIEQETVDNGIPLQAALRSHVTFLEKHGLVSAVDAAAKVASKDVEGRNKKKTFIYATCGNWDLLKCLPKQLQYHDPTSTCPRHLSSWCNLKKAFRDLYDVKPTGMVNMLGHVGLELEGRHHSGIDDCRNLARLVEKMLLEGWMPQVTGTTLREL